MLFTLTYPCVAAVPEAFDKQMEADRAQGYDFVGYHAYAKRRYFEMVWRKSFWCSVAQ